MLLDGECTEEEMNVIKIELLETNELSQTKNKLIKTKLDSFKTCLIHEEHVECIKDDINVHHWLSKLDIVGYAMRTPEFWLTISDLWEPLLRGRGTNLLQKAVSQIFGVLIVHPTHH